MKKITFANVEEIFSTRGQKFDSSLPFLTSILENEMSDEYSTANVAVQNKEGIFIRLPRFKYEFDFDSCQWNIEDTSIFCEKINNLDKFFEGFKKIKYSKDSRYYCYMSTTGRTTIIYEESVPLKMTLHILKIGDNNEFIHPSGYIPEGEHHFDVCYSMFNM